jgi:hypothetical protein
MVKSSIKKKTKKGKKLALSPEKQAFLKLQTEHRSLIRSIFRAAGFDRVSGVADKEFTFVNQTTDIDDVFVFENITR